MLYKLFILQNQIFINFLIYLKIQRKIIANQIFKRTLMRNEQYMDISSDFNYNLDFGRLMWAPDIFFAWPESINEIDRGMWLWSVITPIVFKCFRQEYLQIVKGVIHNFTFDDQQDMFFIGESSQLNFYEYYDHQDNMITEENTEAYRQAYNVLEICFIGDISKVQTLQLQQKKLRETLDIDISFIEDKILDQRQRSAYQQYKIEDLDDKNVQLIYQNLINNESGDKDQQLSFINQKIYAKASVLVNIFHWVMMEQHVFPEVPWYGDLNRIRFEVNLKDVIILLPNYEQRYALATKGFIQYLFLKEKMPAHENLQEMIKKKLIDQEYLNNLGDLYTNSVNVSDLEIFRCDIEDVIYKDFNQVKKRSLISPLTMFWALKFQLGIYDQGDSPYYPTYFKPRHELSLNHLQVNISYRDTILIKNVADFFKKEFSLIRKETPSQKEIINQEIKNRDKDKCPQIMKLDCIIQQLEFYLINDAQQGCVPVLQFNLEEIQLFLDQEKNIKTIFSAMFTFSSAFYNTQASIWEPTIEKTGLILELQLNPQSFPRKFAYIELNPIYDQININFSLELCEVVMQAIKQINQYKSEEEAKKNQKQKEELQELDLPNPTLMTLDRQESSKNLIQGSYRQSRLESQLNYQRMPTQVFQNYQENKIQSSPLKKSRISKTVQNNALSSSNLSQKNKNNLLNKLVKNLSDEKQQFDDAVEYVSPYTIYNELGYTIEVMKDFQAQLNINKKNDGKIDIRQTDMSNTMLKNATQFIIPAQGNLNYQVEGKMNFCKLYDGQTREKKKIRIQMRHPKYNNIYINNIDLDKMGKQTYIFKIDSDALEQILEPVNIEREKVASEVQNQEQKEKNKSQVQDIENGIDNNKNINTSINDQLTKFPFTIENITQHSRKIMLIRSNLKFKNLVNKPIQIKLISREDSNNLKIAQQQLEKQQQNKELSYDYSQPQRKPGVTLEYDTFDGQLQNAYVINPGQSIYLPFDKLDHYLQFRYLDLKTDQINRTTKSKYFDRVEVLDFVDTQSEWSKEIDLLHLLNSTETYTNFEVQQLGKEQYCCQFTYQRVNDEASIVVEPSLVLKNCLPVPLMFKLFEEDQQSNLIHLMEGVANPQELVYKLNISLEKNIWTEVRIQGYEESQQVLLHQKDNQSNLSEICNGICTKIIDINPKYIMINSCKGDIKVAQYKSDGKNNLDAFVIKPQQKLPFYWKSDYDEQKIRIQLQDNYKQYDWSGPIDLLQTYSLMLRNQLRPKDIKVIKSQIREEDDIIYIIISECQNEDQSQFVIENKLQNAQIEIIQEAYYKHVINNNQTGIYQDPEKFKIVLKEGQSIIYGWDLPLEQQEIKVQLKIQDQISHKYDFDNININFGNNKQTVEVKYEADSKYTDDTYTFYTYIDTDNVFKKLKFYQNDDESGFQEIMKEDNFELSFNLNLKQIGVSLIGRSIENNNKKVELMYITLKNIEVSIMQYQSRRITQAKIDFIQIDNNSQAVTSYPVFFTPSRPSKLNKLNRAHFRLVMEQNLEVKDINLLQSVRCALQPTTIRLNIQYFSQIWSFVSDMMKIFKQKVVDSIFTQFGGFDDDFQNDLLEIELQNQFQSQFDKIDEQYKGQLNYQNTINSRQKFGSEDSQQKNFLFDNRSGNLPNGYYDEIDISMEEQLYDWYQKDIESLLGKTFINEISISNLQFNVSFGQSSLENKMQINFIKNIFQTLKNAPVKLDQIMISSSQSTAFSTIKYITTKYKDSFVKSLLTVLASIKIIGNPTNLVKTMARGVYDVIDIPMTGFVKGPIQGAISIAHGVGSLVKHTVSGFFGSMESISEVVASGVSSISQDSRYLLQRENILAQKASNIVPGIYQGVYLLVIGFEKGVTGVLKQPIRGFQTGGGFGLCKGVLKGSVGLFLKPITGCFDTISKSSEGIKNTATYFDDKPNEEKIRKPRVFYDLDQIFGNFNPFHAEIREFLIETKKQKYYWLTFIDAVPYHDTQDIQHLIIFTNEYIIQKRLEKSKIDLELEVKYLKQVNIKDQAQSVEIKLFQDRKNNRDGQITFDIKHPEMRKQIFARFQQILGQ
ncbi:hypothetical protein PPERSA_00756 [Pseudocohnilembus persalinus]|uniref:Vacuolar protein sorting-associated protein 13 VPS13 adaptor binding domain-containing protein n=1 Tax=Pseudocohnilembus persalinus TaxID=266149 RepID=A0A0V0R5G6_PSEPJ|nr:hypothetical protein PPERSA_00756 [Pseudocohnilembus persalinus]|eukprot:KRX09477.1 hypothetical protein PPERSA_00756 [Pseudocohnilembus persalinus]